MKFCLSLSHWPSLSLFMVDVSFVVVVVATGGEEGSGWSPKNKRNRLQNTKYRVKKIFF